MKIIDRANGITVGRILDAEPVLVDVTPAGVVIEGLGDGMILHAGPPIGWDRMCGPMRGAIGGAIVLEGWAAISRFSPTIIMMPSGR